MRTSRPRSDSLGQADPPSEPSIAAVAAKPGGHVPELDGIRAIAIWAVLIEHLVFADPVTAAGRAFIPHALLVPLDHLWLGVDLFFVLSGFLITGILLKTKTLARGEFFRRFYLRRALRIWPLYFVVLAALCVAYGSHFATYFVMCVLFIANLTPAGVPIPDGAGPFWSLSVEEQFYLVWPWLVLLLGRRKLMTAAAAIIVLELIARCFARPDQLVLTWFRADGLAMGAFVAAWFAGHDREPRAARRLIWTLLGSALALGLIDAVGQRTHLLAIGSITISEAICVFGALLVAGVAFSGTPWLAILRTRFAERTAVLSYAIYLLHRPAVDAFGVVAANAAWFSRMSPSSQTIVRAVLVIAVCYVGAMVTRALVERPFLRLGRERITPRVVDQPATGI